MADDKDNEDFEHVSNMADRLGLKGRDRSTYIRRHMTGLGYREVPTYVQGDDGDDDDDDSDASGIPRRRRGRTRDDSQDRSRRRRGRDSGGSWYDED